MLSLLAEFVNIRWIYESEFIRKIIYRKWIIRPKPQVKEKKCRVFSVCVN